MGFVSLIEKNLSHQDETRLTISRVKDQLANIEKSIELMREYEKLGQKPPRWYTMEEVLMHSSLLAQFFKTESDPTIAGLKVFAPPLFEHILANLLENAQEHGKNVTRLTISFRIVHESGILSPRG